MISTVESESVILSFSDVIRDSAIIKTKDFVMEIIIGIVGCVVGIGVLSMHIFAPHKLGKLAAFQKNYGNVAGKVMHIFFYGIIPLGIGMYFLVHLLLNK